MALNLCCVAGYTCDELRQEDLTEAASMPPYTAPVRRPDDYPIQSGPKADARPRVFRKVPSQSPSNRIYNITYVCIVW
jgi:hypothetical protein